MFINDAFYNSQPDSGTFKFQGRMETLKWIKNFIDKLHIKGRRTDVKINDSYLNIKFIYVNFLYSMFCELKGG
jgi:hypothetical protein